VAFTFNPVPKDNV